MSAPPFTGREQAHRALLSEMDAGASILLRGSAGVGKSRLAEEVAESLVSAGRRVDRLLACVGTQDIALGALVSVGPGSSASEGPSSQLDWYLRRWRAHQRAGRRTIVWLDDVHHLDDVSAALLRQAVSAREIQLLCATREVASLPRDIGALLVEGALRAVDVAPLGRTAAESLVLECARDDLSTSVRDVIVDVAAGYPLFLRELARAPTPGVLPREGAAEFVLRQRLETLSDDLRVTAELVALAQPVPAALLHHRRDAVDDLLHEGLLVTCRPDSLRLEHPLQAEWLASRVGSARTSRFAELVECARAQRPVVDDLRLAQWQLARGGALPPTEAARAVRLALARSDVVAARKLVAHATDARDLLDGQIACMDGDLAAGLQLLQKAVRDSPDPALRVEAASLLVRHLGLTRGDFAGAHETLTRVETSDLTVPLRRHLLLGRLWLRLFGPDIGPRITPESDLLLDARHGVDQLSFDIATAAGCVFLQSEGVHRAAPPLRHAARIEPELEVEPASWCRARSVETWTKIFDGDLMAGLAIVHESALRAREEQWHEGYALLLGNLGLTACQAGVLRPLPPEAATPNCQLEFEHPPGADLYRLYSLASAAWRTNCLLAPRTPDVCHHELEHHAPSTSLPLLDVLRARATAYGAELRGERDADSLLVENLTRLGNENLNGWLAFVYLDVCDLNSPAAAHDIAIRHLEKLREVGLYGMAYAAAQARRDLAPRQLLDVAGTLERRGFAIAATRAHADAWRLRPTSAMKTEALRGLAAGYTRWTGAPMTWLRDVDDLPTPRQLQIARAVVKAGDVHSVAIEMSLSRRTIENHVYRVSRALGASGRDELERALNGLYPQLPDTVVQLV